MVNAFAAQPHYSIAPAADPRFLRAQTSFNTFLTAPPPVSSRSSTYSHPPRDSVEQFPSWRTARPSEPYLPRSPPAPSFDPSSQSSSSRMETSVDSSRAIEPQHRVYILHCRCGAFISDRGMRAVLLLRPSITLFSTDASPTNCGPLPIDESGEAGTCGVERTCDCLTQSLACYECGNVVGYHIMHPCSRCVDSVSRQHRAGKANGHRWVFHYGEVSSRERRYVYGERGIILPGRPRTRPCSPVDPSNHPTPRASTDHYSGPDVERAKVDVPTLPDEHGTLVDGDGSVSVGSGGGPGASSGNGSGTGHSTKHSPSLLGPTPMLRDGDTLFWHMLKASGERAPPVDPASRRISRPAR